jgi:hypothetical protein
METWEAVECIFCECIVVMRENWRETEGEFFACQSCREVKEITIHKGHC